MLTEEDLQAIRLVMCQGLRAQAAVQIAGLNELQRGQNEIITALKDLVLALADRVAAHPKEPR